MRRKIGLALGVAAGIALGIAEGRTAGRLDEAAMDGISAGSVKQLSTRQSGNASGPSASVNQSTTITGTGSGYQVQQSQQGSADGANGSQNQANTCTGPCAASQTTRDSGPGGQVNLSQSYTTDPPPPPPATRPNRPRLPWLRL
jgi:hypothetical protein